MNHGTEGGAILGGMGNSGDFQPGERVDLSSLLEGSGSMGSRIQWRVARRGWETRGHMGYCIQQGDGGRQPGPGRGSGNAEQRMEPGYVVTVLSTS